MVLQPSIVSMSSPDWAAAAALFQVLAIKTNYPLKWPEKTRRFITTPEEFLERPKVWRDQKLVPAPYFSYCIRFNVSAVVFGSIPVDANDQLALFKNQVMSALSSPMTNAERNRIREQDALSQCCYSQNGEQQKIHLENASNYGQAADHYYREAQERQYLTGNKGHHASRVNHDSIMAELVSIGTGMIEQTTHQQS